MRKHLYKIITLIIIVVVVVLIYFNSDHSINIQSNDFLETLDTVVIIPPTIDEIIRDGIPNDTTTKGLVYETKQYYVFRGLIDNVLSLVLEKYNMIPNTDKLRIAAKDIFDIDKVVTGKPYFVICSKDSISITKCFVYEQSKTEYVVFDFRDSISVYKGEKEVRIINNIVSGTIKQGGGLSVSLSKKLGEDKAAPLVDMLANKIYAWTIDFVRIQAADSFIVHFEERYVGDQYVGIGKIHAASFTHKGKIINAFRFKENENYSDYFDENGNNLRKAFLMSPVDFIRISSKFGKRKHPISGKWKTHKGTDYAAKTGTPIMATANGTIEFAGRKGGYGKCVIVKHNDKYKTLYAHMSKIKSGISNGAYVKQTDIIGYVGSTGYATGPHLHYEFWLYGKPVDPYKQELPPSLPLKEENKESFEKVKDKYLKILENFVK